MNVNGLKAKLDMLNVEYSKAFKPNFDELLVYEQLCAIIDQPKPFVSNDIPLARFTDDKLKELPKF